MRHASLFSGIGGFDLAAQWMGWENVFQVEIDNWCRRILAKHFPSTKRYVDIQDFNGLNYEHSIDIISGGFPCQPFSQAGKQRGKEDDRYLWPEMLRIISQIKPTWIIGENVPGIIQMAQFDSQPPVDSEGNPIGNPGDIFTHRGQGILGKEILESLKKEGYEVQPFDIPACAVNAIHRRDRVWILAYSYSNARLRKSREYKSESRKEWIQKRHEILNSGQSDKIQSFDASYSQNIGWGRRTSKECSSFREGELLSRKSKRSKVGSETQGCSGINFSSNTKRYGFATSEIERSSGEAIYNEQSRKNRSFNSKRDSNIPASEADVPNTDIRRDRRYQRTSIQETSASCSGATQNGGCRRIRFPISQPTICRGDDGISYWLDDGTLISNKERIRALEGLGNAVVPQEVYEIFRIIEKFDQEMKERL